jgi:acetyl-CoA C-acetyltransferase
MPSAYIVAATRTAGGRRDGALAGWHPADMAGRVIDALVERRRLDPMVIDDVVMGCVTQVGEQSFNIGRQAVLSSQLPHSVPGTTVDRQCGSSQQAIQFAAQAVMSGTMDVVIAAGVESMTRTPMGLAIHLGAQHGYGIPRGRRIEARYPGVPFDQFDAAEATALAYGLSREEMDAFALESHEKAKAATNGGCFREEILPLEIEAADGEAALHTIDEGIRWDSSIEAISKVRLLRVGGRVSAATASQICDGAAGVVVMNEAGLKATGAEPLARIAYVGVVGVDPVIGMDGPVFATRKALARTGLRIDDIDLYEINEAFAVAPLAWLQGLGADPDRLNVHGGAIALGHPMGASGAKLMTTLVHALHRRNGRYGLQAMCEGAGTANATLIERL